MDFFGRIRRRTTPSSCRCNLISARRRIPQIFLVALLSASSISQISGFATKGSNLVNSLLNTPPQSKPPSNIGSLALGTIFYPLTEKRASTCLKAKESSTTASSSGSKRNQNPKRNKSPQNRKTALKWVVNNMERLAEEADESDRPSKELIETLRQLVYARSQSEVSAVGRLLESLRIYECESFATQERVMKAAALAGLVKLSCDLLEHMLSQNYFPSPVAYVGVFHTLRDMGRVSKLEKLLYGLGEVRLSSSLSPDGIKGVEVVALNTYLAALCDQVTNNGRRSSARHKNRFPSGYKSLRTACKWLRPGLAKGILGTEPDVISYTTVINAAVTVGNITLAEELFEEVQARNFTQNLYVYNTHFRVLRRKGSSGDDEVLKLLQDLLQDPILEPDRFTIDLVLPPLIRAGQLGDVDDILDSFIERNTMQVGRVSNAFASFLVTLVKENELATAQAIFDNYLAPSITSKPSAKKIDKLARPSVKHFNILIEGYRNIANKKESNDDTKQELPNGDKFFFWKASKKEDEIDFNNKKSISHAMEKANSLYDLMLTSNMRPDGYTLTSMMGMPLDSSGLSSLLNESINDFRIEVTPVIVRAAMAAYGRAADPSSACWLFDSLGNKTMNIRTWNSLLGALASSAKVDNSVIVCVEDSAASRSQLVAKNGVSSEVSLSKAKRESPLYPMGISTLLDGKNSVEAVKTLVDIMNGKLSDFQGIAPNPNSQTYCVAASALQHGPTDTHAALELFRTASEANLEADGRFINAVFRCFGDEIDAALTAWRNDIRKRCITHEYRTRNAPPSIHRKMGKNLIAAYHGLIYVCGRALRPDIALRLVYAMTKEGLDCDENALNCYKSGKRIRRKLASLRGPTEEEKKKEKNKVRLSKQYETLLQIECTKYDKNDKRRAADKRLKIIL